MSRFRKAYRELTAAEKGAIDAFKTLAEDMDGFIDEPEDGADPRYMALARTALEESVMWFTKGVTG